MADPTRMKHSVSSLLRLSSFKNDESLKLCVGSIDNEKAFDFVQLGRWTPGHDTQEGRKHPMVLVVSYICVGRHPDGCRFSKW